MTRLFLQTDKGTDEFRNEKWIDLKCPEAIASRHGNDCRPTASRKDDVKKFQKLKFTVDFIGTDGGNCPVNTNVDAFAYESNTTIAQAELPTTHMPAGE